MPQEEAVADEVLPGQRVRLVDPPDAHGGATRQREPHRDDVAHREVVVVGRCGVDEQLAGGQCLRGPRRHVEDHRLGQVLGPEAQEIREGVAELELAAVDDRGGGDAGDPGRHDRHGVAELPVPGVARRRDDDVCADRVVHTARGRARQRGAEHGDGRDERQPDHQRRRRLGRAPGAAHGVLPAQAARGAEQPGQRATDDARHGPRHRGCQHRDAHEDQDRTEADQLDGRLREPDGQQHDPDRGDDTALGEAAPHRHLLLGLLLGHRRHRGDADGARGPG